jgi:hypothetical protein
LLHTRHHNVRLRLLDRKECHWQVSTQKSERPGEPQWPASGLPRGVILAFAESMVLHLRLEFNLVFTFSSPLF